MGFDRESYHRTKQELADILEKKLGVQVYTESFLADKEQLFCLARDSVGKKLYSAGTGSAERLDLPDPGRKSLVNETLTVFESPLSSANAARLRKKFTHLAPSVIGIHSSAGFGDRLGCATPGHVRALLNSSGESGFFRPVFAQQSTRENLRTGRSSLEVIDDAMWGVMQSGWKDGYGADADHLKTTIEISECLRNGYTFFTIDPGDHVKNVDASLGGTSLDEELELLPWDRLETSWPDLRGRLAGKPLRCGERVFELDESSMAVAAVKYGRAVAHTVEMYRHLLDLSDGKKDSFELEVSVDETESPTTAEEHLYIATELRRLGVEWQSLAPRFPGRFEKGVDYQAEPSLEIESSLNELKQSFISHAAIARHFGPYKISLHSGSDKFLAYPLLSEAAGELVHLKTAGTSYLEALRVTSVKDPGFFRKAHQFAVSRYPEDKASYHVSADLDLASDTLKMDDSELVSVFDSLHDRQILHVTFGSLLNDSELKGRLLEILDSQEEQYYDFLDAHFRKHLEPFMA